MPLCLTGRGIWKVHFWCRSGELPFRRPSRRLRSARPVSAVPTQFPANRRFGERIGDPVLYGLTGAAGLGAIALIIAIAYKVFDGTSLAFSKFGFGFLGHGVWTSV
jgi:hypothetical protein